MQRPQPRSGGQIAGAPPSIRWDSPVGASSGGPPWPHLAGLVLLGGAALAAGGLSALSLGVMASAILVLVAVWEQILRSPAADLPAPDG